MGTRERPADLGHRRARDQLYRVAADVRLARIAAGLSLRAVARAAGVDHATLWRLEVRQTDVAVRDLAAVCRVVGLDLAIRTYPSGDPIRDAAHVRLLERLRSTLREDVGWSTEVPLPIPGDPRAWDAVIAGRDWRVGVEAETALRDIQVVERKLALKRRDGGIPRVILLIADTRHNRAAFRCRRFPRGHAAADSSGAPGAAAWLRAWR